MTQGVRTQTDRYSNQGIWVVMEVIVSDVNMHTCNRIEATITT